MDKLTEDETTLILLSLSYVMSCMNGNGPKAKEFLGIIVDTVSDEEVIEMSQSILNKLDETRIKPFNSIIC